MPKIISPRIAPVVEDWLTENFKTRTGGAEYVLEAFYSLYRRTMHELKGRFADGELKLMLDVFNSTALTPGIAGQQLLISCVDGMELDNMDDKWDVDRASLTGKLQALSLFEAACLEIWANGFWYAEDTGNFDLDVEKYIKPVI